MSLSSSAVHEIDTRQGTALTVFDGSQEDESKLAKQFWNSMALVPPVESTLVCKEIRQLKRSRTLNDETARPRFSTTLAKVKEEKSSRDKDYNEIAAFQQAREEAKEIQVTGKRHQQVRQLFRDQTKANRVKKKQWAMPPQLGNHPVNGHQQRTRMYFEEGIDNEYDDNHDRDLVCSLPD